MICIQHPLYLGKQRFLLYGCVGERPPCLCPFGKRKLGSVSMQCGQHPRPGESQKGNGWQSVAGSNINYPRRVPAASCGSRRGRTTERYTEVCPYQMPCRSLCLIPGPAFISSSLMICVPLGKDRTKPSHKRLKRHMKFLLFVNRDKRRKGSRWGKYSDKKQQQNKT